MLAVLIVVATVALVIWQPRGFWTARAVTLGVIHLSDLPLPWHATCNATLTLVSLIALNLLLDVDQVDRTVLSVGPTATGEGGAAWSVSNVGKHPEPEPLPLH